MIDSYVASTISSDSKTISAPAIALVAADHRLVAVTDAFAELVGYSPAELCGKTFEQITHPADIDIDSDLATRLFRGRIPSYELAKRYVHKNGQIVRILLAASVVRDRLGKIVFAVAQIRPLAQDVPAPTLPVFQHEHEKSDEIEKIKRAMLR